MQTFLFLGYIGLIRISDQSYPGLFVSFTKEIFYKKVKEMKID